MDGNGIRWRFICCDPDKHGYRTRSKDWGLWAHRFLIQGWLAACKDPSGITRADLGKEKAGERLADEVTLMIDLIDLQLP